MHLSVRIDLLQVTQPSAPTLTYHSPVPLYEGHKAMEHCNVLYSEARSAVEQVKHRINGGKCYYDGSGVNAERVYEILLRKGSDGVWEELESYYKDTFKELR